MAWPQQNISFFLPSLFICGTIHFFVSLLLQFNVCPLMNSIITSSWEEKGWGSIMVNNRFNTLQFSTLMSAMPILYVIIFLPQIAPVLLLHYHPRSKLYSSFYKGSAISLCHLLQDHSNGPGIFRGWRFKWLWNAVQLIQVACLSLFFSFFSLFHRFCWHTVLAWCYISLVML